MEENKFDIKWVNPEHDLEDEYMNHEFNQIIGDSEANEKLLCDMYQNNDFDKLEKSVRFGQTMMSYFVRMLKSQERSYDLAVYEAGKLAGYLEFIDKIRYRKDRFTMIQDRMNIVIEKAKCTIDPINNILKCIDAGFSCTQNDIKQYVKDLDDKLLTSILQELTDNSFLNRWNYNVDEFGNPVYQYTLSDDGIFYFNMMRQ